MKFAIFGAGSAGQGLAGHLALQGHDVTLFNHPSQELRRPTVATISRRKGIEVVGVEEGFAKISAATTNAGAAMAGADVICFALRAFAHRDVLELCIPHFEKGQILLIVTGYWASLRLGDLLRGVDEKITVAETTLLPLISEALEPGKVRISGIKSSVKMAACDPDRSDYVLASIGEALPQLVAAKNILEVNLDNSNPVFHPVLGLFNLGAIETIPTFEFYHQGITPKIARVLDAVDGERVALAARFGADVQPGIEMLKQYYSASGSSTFEIMKNCQALDGYVLPNVFDYMREDVPYGLVPIASLCEVAGVPSVATRSIISAWSLVDSTDYWGEGFTTRRLGLAGMTVAEILTYVETQLGR